MRRHTRHEWMTRCILRHCVPSAWLQHTATDCNIHCNTFLKTTTPEIRKETYLGILRHCVSFSWRDALMCVTWWGGVSDLIFTRCVTPFSLDLGATTWLWGGSVPIWFGGGGQSPFSLDMGPQFHYMCVLSSWRDAFMWVAWHIHACDMNRSYVIRACQNTYLGAKFVWQHMRHLPRTNRSFLRFSKK